MAIEKQHFDRIADWLAAGLSAVVVRIVAVKGSAPRNEDAVMAVNAEATVGTIGGGQLEWIVIARARDILAGIRTEGELDVPLGPEIGQCCGGRVRLSLRKLESGRIEELRGEAEETEKSLPQVLIFGAGHTGKALAASLALLPVRARLVDSRPEAFAGYYAPLETVTTPLPEEMVRQAPAGGAFVSMTHEHALDFLITAEALKRGDAAYCGMIGSATKRAVFVNWLAENGHGRTLGKKLVCPIGGSAVNDKRPAVIAALTAAEILAAIHLAQVAAAKP